MLVQSPLLPCSDVSAGRVSLFPLPRPAVGVRRCSGSACRYMHALWNFMHCLSTTPTRPRVQTDLLASRVSSHKVADTSPRHGTVCTNVEKLERETGTRHRAAQVTRRGYIFLSTKDICDLPEFEILIDIRLGSGLQDTMRTNVRKEVLKPIPARPPFLPAKSHACTPETVSPSDHQERGI